MFLIWCVRSATVIAIVVDFCMLGVSERENVTEI